MSLYDGRFHQFGGDSLQFGSNAHHKNCTSHHVVGRGPNVGGAGQHSGGKVAELCGFVVVCWLLYVPATRSCISGTNLLRQFHVLPH